MCCRLDASERQVLGQLAGLERDIGARLSAQAQRAQQLVLEQVERSSSRLQSRLEPRVAELRVGLDMLGREKAGVLMVNQYTGA
jgi:hypothetical protein